MPLNGEWVLWADAWVEQNTHTESWTIEFPPAAVMAKVSQAFYMEYSGKNVGMVGTQIASIRHRVASGADETVPVGNVPAVFDNQMTAVTYGLFIYNCQARIVLDLGFWS